MKLSKIYENLVASEVFTYEFADSDGVLLPQHRRRITTLINSGLSALYQRFVIRESRLKLVVTEDRKAYLLEPMYAKSQSSDGYIDDLEGKPFQGDVLEVLRVEVPSGQVVTLNDTKSTTLFSEGPYGNHSINASNYSLCTSSNNELLFTHVPRPGIYTVIYKADAVHTPLQGIDEIDPSTVEIDLPLTYLNALCYYVAAKVYNPAGAESVARSMFHEGNNWRSMYEEECQRISANVAGNKSFNEVSNFQRGGWV